MGGISQDNSYGPAGTMTKDGLGAVKSTQHGSTDSDNFAGKMVGASIGAEVGGVSGAIEGMLIGSILD